MRKILFALTICIGGIMSGFASDESEIMAVYENLQNAMINKDIEYMDSIIDDTATFTHITGKVQTKEEYLGEIKDGILNYFEYEILEPDLSVDGDTAYLKAITKLTARVYGASGTWPLRTGVHFRKDDNGWRISGFDAAGY